jgi:hypothetical protein
VQARIRGAARRAHRPELPCRAVGIAEATGRDHSECFKRLLDKLADALCLPGTKGKRFDYTLESEHTFVIGGRESKRQPRRTTYVCLYERKR